MEKKLFINANPNIRTYTYHGFNQSIISASDKVNEYVAKVNVKDFSKYIWQTQNEHLSYVVDDNDVIIFKSNKWNIGMNMNLWRLCKDSDEIEATILEQLFSNVWGQINLFVALENQSNELLETHYLLRLGRFNKLGTYAKIKQQFKAIPKTDLKLPITMKLSKCGNRITIYCKGIDGELVSLYSEENDIFSSDRLRIGFEVLLGNSTYYEWTFSNYIQIFGDVNGLLMNIDYLWNCDKNWSYYTMNYFLDYNNETMEAIHSYGMTVLDYIKKNIDLGRYIDIKINENIINNIPDEPTPYFHQNLVYGYDDDERKLYIMNYVDGRTKLRFIKYEDFQSNRNTSCDDMEINVIRYNPDAKVYELNRKNLRNRFFEYRNSINSKIDYEYRNQEDDYKYGIELLHDFCTEIGLVKMTFDIRNSHLLYERSKLMKERIEYFLCRKIINQQQHSDVIKLANMSIEITFIIRNMVMKYQINHKKNFDRVKQYLEQLIDNEIKLCDKMINYLES